MGAQMVYLPRPVEEKELEDGGDFSKSGLQYGVAGMQGWRRNMEDSHLTVEHLDENVSLFGVFDGHGGRGVSRFAARRLPEIIRNTEAYKQGNYVQALERGFLLVDEKLREAEGRKEVENLDRPDAGAPARPVAVPRRVLNRFFGNSAGGLGGGRSPEVEAEEADAAPGTSAPGAETGAKPSDAGASGAANAGNADAVDSGKGGKNGAKAASVDVAKPTGDGAGDGATETAAQVADEAAKGSSESTEGVEADDDDDDDFLDCEDVDAVEEEMEEEDLEVDAMVDEDEAFEGEDMALVDPGQLTRDPTPEAQGCTAVVVLLVRKPDASDGSAIGALYCANAGDSRAILSRGGKVVALSEDHKPENDEETARITKAGGYVQHMPGGARVQGDLNLSRAFGDLRYKKPDHLPPEQQILTAFPEVRTFEFKSEDEFMVLGCDGIWERSGNQEMVDFVRPRVASRGQNGEAKPLSSICAEICDKGLCPSMNAAENDAFDGTGCDNMTVLVVQLQRELPSSALASLKRPLEDPPAPDAETISKRPCPGSADGRE